MSTYVLSDLHGQYNKFMDMLKLIKFNDNDKMYILGDIFDRGPDPLKILDYIICKKNIDFIPGNHEYMFLEFYNTYDARLWSCNGGRTTMTQLMKRGEDYLKALYDYLTKLPLVKIHDKFILTHAGLYLPKNQNQYTLQEILSLQNAEFNLWSRSNINNERQYKDYTVICGHTPTLYVDPDQYQMSIVRREGTIYIDCGATFSDGRLACLRLEDNKEFYI